MAHRRTHRTASVLLAGLLTLGFVAYPESLLMADEHDEVTVSMELFGFDPDELATSTGTTVTWINDEMLDYPAVDGTHRVVADDGSFDSGELQPRQSFSMRFLEPATITYRCVIHPALMTGSLEIAGPPVKPEPSRKDVAIVEPSANVPDSWRYQPDDITIDEGSTVVWRNNGAQTHTVTATDGSFDSADIEPGTTFPFTFEEPVTIRYACTPHPWMTGIVRVRGAGGEPPPPPPERGGAKGGGSTPVVEQPEREGSEPATFNVLAVEPDPVAPLGWGFEPRSLTVRAGDTIVWRNGGSATHTVTATDGSFDSGDLDPGATFSRVVEQTGTIPYACSPHPWMKGTILVVSAGVQGELPVAPPPPVDDGASQPGQQTPRPTTPRGDGEIEPDPAAAVRTPLAIGTGGLALLLGLILILPTLLERSRRRVVVLEETPAPAREHADALR